MLTAILQARCGSTRLPHKVLEYIGYDTMLEKVIKRVKAINVLKPDTVNNIIVATTKLKEDDYIEGIAKKNDVECFRGHDVDVLSRYYKCARKYETKNILRITGDCPLLDPVLVYGLIKEYRKMHFEYMSLCTVNSSFLDGWDAELFSFKALEDAFKFAGNEEREHVSTYMRNNISIKELKSDLDLSDLKLSVDTKEDLKNVREYFKYL